MTKISSLFYDKPSIKESVGETLGPISFKDWKEKLPQEFEYWKSVAKITNSNYERTMNGHKDSPLYKKRFPWSGDSLLLWCRYQENTNTNTAEGYAVAFNKNHGYVVFLSRRGVPNMLPEANIYSHNLERLFPDIHEDAHEYLRNMTPYVVMEAYERIVEGSRRMTKKMSA